MLKSWKFEDANYMEIHDFEEQLKYLSDKEDDNSLIILILLAHINFLTPLVEY
jgi:hypothetical protein